MRWTFLLNLAHLRIYTYKFQQQKSVTSFKSRHKSSGYESLYRFFVLFHSLLICNKKKDSVIYFLIEISCALILIRVSICIWNELLGIYKVEKLDPLGNRHVSISFACVLYSWLLFLLGKMLDMEPLSFKFWNVSKCTHTNHIQTARLSRYFNYKRCWTFYHVHVLLRFFFPYSSSFVHLIPIVQSKCFLNCKSRLSLKCHWILLQSLSYILWQHN